MLEYYQDTKKITVNEIDLASRLNIYSVMQILQNAATAHAATLGYDFENMLRRDNTFWVITKLRFLADSMPIIDDEIVIKSWPLKPGKIVLERDFELCKDNKTFLSATSEWCLLNADTRRPIRTEGSCIDNDNEHITNRARAGSFTKEKYLLEEKDFVHQRTIRSSDIDVNGHTNNAKYTQMIMDAFENKFLINKMVVEYQINFLLQSYEGQILNIYKKEIEENNYYLCGRCQEKNIFTALVKFK